MTKLLSIIVAALLCAAAAPSTRPASRPDDPQQQQREEREAKRIGYAIANGKVVFGMTVAEAGEAACKGNTDLWHRAAPLNPGDVVHCASTVVIDTHADNKPANENLYLIEGPAGVWVVKVKPQTGTVLVVDQVGWNPGRYVTSRLTRR